MKIYTIKYYFYNTTPNQIVPYNYHDNIKSFLNNIILGENNKYHGKTSLISVSRLFNSVNVPKQGLKFEKGALWFIKTPKFEIFVDILTKSKNCINSEFGFGLKLKSVEYKFTEFSNEEKKSELRISANRVFLGQNENNPERDHVTFEHGKEITSKILKRIFLTRTKLLGFDIKLEDFDIEFDLNSKTIKTNRDFINNSSNVTTTGHVIIKGTQQVIGLCYGLGLGVSTSNGFGFISNIK